jgi:hypothetical protein
MQLNRFDFKTLVIRQRQSIFVGIVLDKIESKGLAGSKKKLKECSFKNQL